MLITLLRRLGTGIVAAAAVVSMAAAPGRAMPAPESWDDGGDVTPVMYPYGGDTWPGVTFGGDDRRLRPRVTPTVVFEQRCLRRGLCLIRVFIDDGQRQWVCRPGVSTRGRDDDAVEGREGHTLERSDTSWSGSDWGGEDDDVARPRVTRLRLACVRVGLR